MTTNTELPELRRAGLALRRDLLAAVPIFNAGYFPVFKTEGALARETANGLEPLRPGEHEGDFFYLRLTGPARYAPAEGERQPRKIAACAPAAEIVAPTRLVALAAGADPFALEQHLRAFLVKWQTNAPDARAEPRQVWLDGLALFGEETGRKGAKPPALASGRAALLGIDFDLRVETLAAGCPLPPLCRAPSDCPPAG